MGKCIELKRYSVVEFLPKGKREELLKIFAVDPFKAVVGVARDLPASAAGLTIDGCVEEWDGERFQPVGVTFHCVSLKGEFKGSWDLSVTKHYVVASSCEKK